MFASVGVFFCEGLDVLTEVLLVDFLFVISFIFCAFCYVSTVLSFFFFHSPFFYILILFSFASFFITGDCFFLNYV